MANSTIKARLQLMLGLGVLGIVFTVPVFAETVAFLTPDKAETSKSFAEKLTNFLSLKFRVLDNGLSETAYLSVSPPTPFNLTTEESKQIGAVIGCDAFVIVRSATQRRSSFQRPEYYDSYAVIYVVSSRTGKLIFWKLQQFQANEQDKAAKLLIDSAQSLSGEIDTNIKKGLTAELSEPETATMEELPDENSPLNKNFRAPIPYRRIKPEYTAQASLYDVKGTVDMLISLDATGSIVKTQIVRWAGFGLDESVEAVVRLMNWRPAERNGKPLALRFLVRYNFKKPEQLEINR